MVSSCIIPHIHSGDALFENQTGKLFVKKTHELSDFVFRARCRRRFCPCRTLGGFGWQFVADVMVKSSTEAPGSFDRYVFGFVFT